MNRRWVLSLLLLTAAGASAQTEFTFSDNGVKRRYRMEQDVSDSKSGNNAISRNTPLVFYDLSDLPENATPERRIAARRILTNKILIRLPGGRTDYDQIRSATQASSGRESLEKGWWTVSYSDPMAALRAIRILNTDSKWEFIPLFKRQQFSRKTQARALQRPVNDPLFPRQWNLAGSNVSIGLNDTWDVATGKGINITVVDDGLEIAHPDLRDNVYPLSTGYHRNFNDGTENDPTPTEAKQSHGTSCAGIAAARGFNNLGVTGVAPEARLMGLRLIAGENDEEEEGIAFSWQPDGLVTHVSSNSWGPNDDGADSGRPGRLTLAGHRIAATENRNGLGTVIVISAGNGRQSGDDSSYDGFAGSRYAIAVGAVNRNGESSSYSERGMNVAVSAPGGEFEPPETIWTTNVSGPEALGILQQEKASTAAPQDYTDGFNGTSAAAPHVSGAAALLLERFPNLGYRDVKEILMRSARRDVLRGGDPFVNNGGGIPFSHSFGAGLLNVSAALEMARNWKNLGPLEALPSEVIEGEEAIPDENPRGVTASFDFSRLPNVRVESVEFTVTVQHPSRGDLSFQIESPSGMKSIAMPRPADKNADFIDYTFTSVRHWGESSRGTWKVTVADLAAGDEGILRSVAMRIYGVRN